MITKPIVILLTATLNPGAYRDSVLRAEPRLRTQDYVESLNFWAGLDDPRITGIVFCENSGGNAECALGSALDGVLLRRPIEWLTFDGNTRPTGMHYGYSELGILDYAVSHSKLLQSTDKFIKVTGRLRFPQISELLESFNDDLLFAADCRRAYRGESGPPIRVRTELVFLDKQFYLDHLHECRDEMLNSCSHIEEFLALKVLPFQNDSNVMLRFRMECPSVGTAAHNDMEYQKGKYLLKSIFRQILRKIAPWIWL